MASKLKLTNENGKVLELSSGSITTDKQLDPKDFKYIRNTVKDMLDLNNKLEDGDVVFLKGYHTVNDGGGGTFIYNPLGSKSDHNGGTIIDPNKTFPEDWSNQDSLDTWFNTTNTGNGILERVYNDTVHIKWFGSIGDDNIDDTKSIQKALLSANIILDNGIYKITSKITTKFNISGNGTLKFYTDNTWDSLLLDNDNLTIKDISIIGNLKQCGLQIGSSKNTIIKNINVKDVYQAGINAYSPKNLLIEDCYIENSVNGDGTNSYGDGIYINNGINCVIQRNEIYKFNRIGIVAEGSNTADTNSNNIRINDNIIHYGFNQSLSLDGNELNAGVWVEHTSNFIIYNNYIYDIDTGINQNKNKVGGIQVGGGIYNENTSVISNNNIILPISSKTDRSTFLGFGIGIAGYSSFSNLIVEHNKVNGFYGNGISIVGGYISLIIKDNYFNNCYFSADSHGFLVFQIDHSIKSLIIDNNILLRDSSSYSQLHVCPDINFFSYTNPNMDKLYIKNTTGIIGNKFNNSDIKNIFITNSHIYNGYASNNDIYAIVGLNRYITNSILELTDNTVKYNLLILEDGNATYTKIDNCDFYGISIYWENLFGYVNITNNTFNSKNGIVPCIKLLHNADNKLYFNFHNNIINSLDSNYGFVYTTSVDAKDNLIMNVTGNINASGSTTTPFKKWNYDISEDSCFLNNISPGVNFTNLDNKDFNISNSILMTKLPTADPIVASQLWVDSNNNVKVSQG